jgi:hypothetical protein
MGEARDRMNMGLAPRRMKPEQQIQVDMKNAVPKVCECGCQYFIPAVELFTISALVSPTGQELTGKIPVLVCLKCKTAIK